MRATASFLFAVSQRSVHFVTAHSLQTLARMPAPRYLTATVFRIVQNVYWIYFVVNTLWSPTNWSSICVATFSELRVERIGSQAQGLACLRAGVGRRQC